MAKDKVKKESKYLKDLKTELKRVIWPTPKQVVQSTMGVLAIVLVITVVVLVLDLAFEALNTNGINRLKQAVSDSAENVIEDTNNVTEENIVNEAENTVGNETEQNESNLENNVE